MNHVLAGFECFPNAPVVEAILLIEYVPLIATGGAAVAEFAEAVRDRHPEHLHASPVTSEIGLTPTGGVAVESVTRNPPEHIFRSADGKDLVQLRRNGFAVNRLSPYSDWETFRDRAAEMWHLFRARFEVEPVTRIGLRYLNRIELPVENLDFSDYLRTVPSIPAEIEPRLSEFFLRLGFPENTIPAHGVLTAATGMISDGIPGTLPLTLDIEAVSTGPQSENAIWQTADRLREFKNRDTSPRSAKS